VDDEVGRLLEELGPFEEGLDHDSDEASLLRVTRRDWEKARRIPTELREELTRAGAAAYAAWIEARRDSDFAAFLPYLRRNVELKLRYLECFPDVDEPYDALLDDFEPGMKTAEVRAVFEVMKPALRPLIDAAADVGELEGPFPVERQRAFQTEVLGRFGFDPASWRLDPTVHPFATSMGTRDIRITTRYKEGDLDGLFSTMHEFGHGLYEHQVDRSLERTPLARGASLGLHESQSRMWENLVGRSRSFWTHFYPRLQALFGETLGDVELDEFLQSINGVRPSLIRVESDEVTYNMHIILRFELEQEIVGGRIRLEELPEAWNARMREYLGVEVPDDRRGVLQDVHWSRGSFGYFSTYSLGNVISVQLWERLRRDLPDLDEQVAAAEFGALREWLRDRLHRHGRKYTPQEMLERIVGSGIDPSPYLEYLRGKAGLAAVGA
jgi:carboxypeptidase Taq